MKALSARNPLGIVALFISLIYGICALLLGASVENLSPLNQDRLVWFIIAFPVAILAAFVFLVTRHHRKLYGPGDFRSDEGFLLAGDDPSRIGQKYIEEAGAEVKKEEVAGTPQNEEKANEGAQDPRSKKRAEEQNEDKVTDGLTGVAKISLSNAAAAAQLYLIEGLVMQDLQTAYDASVRRDVGVVGPNGRRLELDGIIETPSGSILVEVKRIRPQVDYSRRLREALSEMRFKLNFLKDAGVPVLKSVLAIVADEGINAGRIAEVTTRYARDFDQALEIRQYKTEDLLRKYGLSTFE